jgi:hypothetical protein
MFVFKFRLRTFFIAIFLLTTTGVGVGRVLICRGELSAVERLRSRACTFLVVTESGAYTDAVTLQPRTFSDWRNAIVGGTLYREVIGVTFSEHSPARDSDARDLASLSSLRICHLSTDYRSGPETCDVTDQGLRLLTACRQMRVLNLSGAKITNSGTRWLEDFSFLEYLVVADTQIDDRSLSSLELCKSLRHLDIRNCRITAEARKELVDKLDQCDVIGP